MAMDSSSNPPGDSAGTALAAPPESRPLREMQKQLALLQDDLRHRARYAASRADHTVQAHPWGAVAAAAALGVVVGLLASRR